MDSLRRKFLKDLGRLFVMGGLGFLGFRLFGKASFRPLETCINNQICRGCSVYSGCGLPQALSAKRALYG